MKFSFCAPGRIIFGKGTLPQLPGLLNGCHKIWLVTGPSAVRLGTAAQVTELLTQAGFDCQIYDGIHGEPTLESVNAALVRGKQYAPDAVIGLGGGSAIDAGKALSGLLRNEEALENYLEGVGTGVVMRNRPLRYVAVPTTAGTGAECTKNAVIANFQARYKRSFRDDRLMPDAALVDPRLGTTVPPQTTAYAGMDALTQLMEAYLSKKANPFTDSLALGAVGRVFRALGKAYEDGRDVDAREDMAYGAMVSGLCLANAGLGAAHGIAASLGAVAGVPHGLACAVLLPHVLRINAPHCAEKTRALAACITGEAYADTQTAAEALCLAVNRLMARLAIPQKLEEYPMSRADLPALVSGVSGSSMGGNPVELTGEQIQKLIAAVLPLR